MKFIINMKENLEWNGYLVALNAFYIQTVIFSFLSLKDTAFAYDIEGVSLVISWIMLILCLIFPYYLVLV